MNRIWSGAIGIVLLAGCEQGGSVPSEFEDNTQVEVAETAQAAYAAVTIGEEKSVPDHLADGQEYTISTRRLLRHGGLLFSAVWTDQEGGGRPLTDGTGNPLVDPSRPLDFPFNFNRISAPDANSCAGCHNAPFAGGGGDIVANVFVLGQRFDFLTFDHADNVAQRGALQENGQFATLQSAANSRNTLGMFGSGYIEMLAREMTADLQTQRDALAPGGSVNLESKGVSFGVLSRNADGSYDTSSVYGLTPMSLGADPSLVIRPFHQASAVVSLREFTNNAFNHHHGIQTTERFGLGTDPDGDGFADEMTRADVTAASIWQATLAVPGRVIPRHPQIEAAVANGESLFASVGCAGCHIPSLPLDDWHFSEPNPYNPPGNLQVGQAPSLSVNLASRRLPKPRLRPSGGVVHVPAFTDLRLHDITCGPNDPNIEQLNMHFSPSDPEFFQGNSRFLTKKLWGAANEPPYFHHGQYTTLRQSIEAHCGAALMSRQSYDALSDYDQASIVEFLKTLQVLPPGTRHLIVDERGRRRSW